MFKKEIIEIRKIIHPVVIYDEGHELFGVFPSGQAAAKAIENSNPSWWAARPVAEEWCTFGGQWGQTVQLSCGCEVEWGGPGAEDCPFPGHYAYCPKHGDSEIA